MTSLEQRATSPLTRLIADRMADQRMTLREVADRAGLSLAAVAALRSGTRGQRPRRSTLEALAQGLALPAEEVLAAVYGNERALEERLVRAFRSLDAAAQSDVVLELEQRTARRRPGIPGARPEQH